MMWALVIAVGLLLLAASFAHMVGARASRHAGPPDGAIVYQDTVDSGSMVPTLTTLPNPLQPTREINATLLREAPTAGKPLFSFTDSSAYDNTDRNPYFRYQGLQRLGNLVTTRSNVYAVWITVGYFEVTPAPTTASNPPSKHSDGTPFTAADYKTVYPDGYQLGRELGVDTGEVERHRAFYIIDRTLPVGFQRGQDLNTEKSILVNRFIE